MALEIFANNPATSVTSGGTTAPAQGTVETWTVASSATFPAASASASPATQFHVADPMEPGEIIAVTNVNGSTWTVTRGAEGTTPVAHAAYFAIEQVVTAGALSGFAQSSQVPSAYVTGTAVLAAGTADVDLASVDAEALIFLTAQVPGGTPGALYVSVLTPGTGFTITSTSPDDTSTVAYLIAG